jgi:hypothetical protein
MKFFFTFLLIIASCNLYSQHAIEYADIHLLKKIFLSVNIDTNYCAINKILDNNKSLTKIKPIDTLKRFNNILTFSDTGFNWKRNRYFTNIETNETNSFFSVISSWTKYDDGIIEYHSYCANNKTPDEQTIIYSIDTINYMSKYLKLKTYYKKKNFVMPIFKNLVNTIGDLIGDDNKTLFYCQNEDYSLSGYNHTFEFVTYLKNNQPTYRNLDLKYYFDDEGYTTISMQLRTYIYKKEECE